MAKGHELLAEKLLSKTTESSEDARSIREDYAYLSGDTPLEVWTWEFIRRNPKYIALYNEIENDFRTTDIVQGDADIDCIHDNIIDSPPIKIKLLRLSNEFGMECGILKGKPRYADNFMNIDKFDFLILIPNPDKKADLFFGRIPEIKGTNCVNGFVINKEVRRFFRLDTFSPLDEQYKDYCYKLIMNELPPIDSSDTLYFGISKSAKKSDIMQQIEEIIDKEIKTSKKRTRDDKWKYYLIAYDLYNKGINYDAISKIMNEAYKDEVPEIIEDDKKAKQDKAMVKKAKFFNRLFDVRNIENYYKNALALINGEYKNYLFLTK